MKIINAEENRKEIWNNEEMKKKKAYRARRNETGAVKRRPNIWKENRKAWSNEIWKTKSKAGEAIIVKKLKKKLSVQQLKMWYQSGKKMKCESVESRRNAARRRENNEREEIEESENRRRNHWSYLKTVENEMKRRNLEEGSKGLMKRKAWRKYCWKGWRRPHWLTAKDEISAKLSCLCERKLWLTTAWWWVLWPHFCEALLYSNLSVCGRKLKSAFSDMQAEKHQVREAQAAERNGSQPHWSL